MSVDYLDWLRHYSTVCQRQSGCGKEALAVLGGAYEDLVVDKKMQGNGPPTSASRINLVAATIQMYIYELQSTEGSAALPAAADPLIRALEHLNQSGVMARVNGPSSGDDDDAIPREHLLKAWRAMSRLPHTVSVQNVTEALLGYDDSSNPSTYKWAVTIFKGCVNNSFWTDRLCSIFC